MSRFIFAAALMFGAVNVAEACGGFVCGPQDPIDQAGEDVFFHAEDGSVEMHVQIEYEGPAEEFAWILPVPANPELTVGTDALFDALSGLRGLFRLDQEFGDCAITAVDSSFMSATYSGNSTAGGGVNVVASGAVGPYATVTLQATDSSALMTWLQDNGFSIPAGIEPLLLPYLADESFFVALKLLKDKDSGDIEPIVLNYESVEMAIPIQLTSIAATPDMRLRVYVAGEHRAVPDSYLHVELNPAAIDWWTLGDNLDDAITKAADEAGGHAFYTDYSGPTDSIQGQIHNPVWDEFLNAPQSAAGVLTRVVDVGLPIDDILLDTLAFHLGLPAQDAAGLDILEILSCLSFGEYGYWYGYDPSCFQDQLQAIDYDHQALMDEVEELILGPRRHAEDLLARSPQISRMTSSISPVEMTVDPTFVFNPDMGEVEQTRRATEEYLCNNDAQNIGDVDRLLHLWDGRIIALPPMNDLAQMGITSFEWMQMSGYTVPTTSRIEQTGPSGQPEVLVDNQDLLNGMTDMVVSGCSGCSATGGPSGVAWAVLPLTLLGLRRRR